MLKPGDTVRITATESDLLYVPEYSRIPILKNKKGVLYHKYKDSWDVRFEMSGIWNIKDEFLEVIK